MTRNQIVELLQRRNDAWATRDIKGLVATYAENAVVVSPFGGVQEGHADIERIYRLWLAAFGDVFYIPEEPVIDGERLVQIAAMKGSHTGEFFGLPPTGRHLEVQMVFVMRVADGLVQEERRIYDFTGVLVQIGVLKAKPTA